MRLSRYLLVAVALFVGWAAYADDEAVSLISENDVFEEKIEYTDSKYAVITNAFKHNWFVTAAGGIQVYWADHNNRMLFRQRISPALDLGFGKWFTPSIGARLMFSGLNIKGATQNGAHTTGEDLQNLPQTGYWLEYQKFPFMSIHADVLFNFSNIILGYKKDRIWNCSPYVGVGFMFTWDQPRQACITGMLGIHNGFRVCDALDLNLDLRGSVNPDYFDGESDMQGRTGEGLFGMTVGLTYKFKKRDFDRAKIITRTNYGPLHELEDQLDATEKERDDLKAALASTRDSLDTCLDQLYAATAALDSVTNLEVPDMLITFVINKSELNKTARVNLGQLAAVVKKSSKPVTLNVTGYADKETGNDYINQRLSENRAKAVRDCLVNEFGVDPELIVTDHKGGVGRMFYNDKALSRAVIITMD